MSFNKARIQTGLSGIGLRAPHYSDIITQNPSVGFVEIHSENFFAKGGKTQHVLKKVSELYPLSFHGVSLSLGSVDEPDHIHLKRLKELVYLYEPTLVSEHVSWSINEETYLNDLLPLPYTQEALDILSHNVSIVQNELGRQILMENPSSYLTFNLQNQMHEGDFMRELSHKTGCGILLDINNVYVSAENLGENALDSLKKVPLNLVKEVHLAGHSHKKLTSGEILKVDTHGDYVCDEVWSLYETFLNMCNKPVATLIEWDNNIPPLNVLCEEAQKASLMLQNFKEVQHHVA